MNFCLVEFILWVIIGDDSFDAKNVEMGLNKTMLWLNKDDVLSSIELGPIGDENQNILLIVQKLIL